MAAVGDWTAYLDDEGRTYYHNAETDETTWDPPPGFEDDGGVGGDDGERTNEFSASPTTPPMGGEPSPEYTQSPPPPAGDDGDDDGFTRSPPPSDDGFTQSPPPFDGGGVEEDFGAEQQHQDEEPKEEEEEEVADGQEIGGGWVAYKDDEGRTYYYNADTEETTWDRPDVEGGEEGAPERDGSRDVSMSEKGGAAAPLDSSPAASQKTPPLDGEGQKLKGAEDGGEGGEAEEEEPKEEAVPPAVAAEQFLQRPDAVMEPGVLDHINTLVQELGPQVAGPKAMQSLMNGYAGDTAVCGLMGLWLAELKSSSGGKGIESSSSSASARSDDGAEEKKRRQRVAFREGADAARDVTEDVFNRMAKERFTKDRGDAIVKLSKKEAAFIDGMIKSERWRKLLIDLSATNKESKLFMYCLQSISNLGHHRAIANRINQSDYFGVFNSMLQSELSIAARVAVDGYAKDVVDSMASEDAAAAKGGGDQQQPSSSMGSLIADLRRTCTSTSYTYLYATKVLDELLDKSNRLLVDGGSKHPESLRRAVRKWRRLREELEEEMLKPIKAGTTHQRKRRIDVALTMSDLFQRKRRRVDPLAGGANDDRDDDDSGFGGASSASNLEDALDSALINLLTKNSLGNQLDKESIDGVLKYAYGGSTDRIGDLLIEHPTAVTALLNNLFGTRRIRQLETRLKCARLVALAVTASERSAKKSSCGGGVVAEVVAESDEDALSQVILKGSQLCEQLENMVSFTVLDSVENTEGSVGRQLSAMCIQYPVVARGALIWATELASGPDFVTTASYPTISPCILSLARLISRYHPMARPAVLDLSLIFMGHSNREISHRKMESMKEQCLRLMLWLSTQGLSLAVISAVQGKLESRGGSSEMDSALVRYFFSGMLEVARPPFSLAFVRSMGGLMTKRPCVDALQSSHFEAAKQRQVAELVCQFESAGDCQELWEEDKALLSSLRCMYIVN